MALLLRNFLHPAFTRGKLFGCILVVSWSWWWSVVVVVLVVVRVIVMVLSWSSWRSTNFWRSKLA